MKSTWSGSIALEGVRVPVKMYPAIKSGRGFSLNTAHSIDKGRLKQQYVCQVCNSVVEKDDKVKAYFTDKKDAVAKAIFTDAEISSLKLDNSDTIQIVAVKEGGVEGDIHELAIRSGTPFYFGCQDVGTHIFSFFHKVLEKLKEENKYAIGIGYMRGKAVMIRFEPYRNVILGVQVVYPDRLYLEADLIDGSSAEVVSGDLLEKGVAIADKLSIKDFDYMEQKDLFIVEAKKRLEQKILGKELDVKIEPKSEVKTQDLEQMINVSL